MDYANSKILITGGTGSFGRHMTDYLLSRGCGHIRILSRDEAKQEAMRNAYASDGLKFYIGDVRSLRSVEEAVDGVDFVFHAAALKQVPSCEFFPLEAVRTNVIGSDNVINAAIAAGVRRTVCLSTDKAVLPINAMGMTKALMEKSVQAAARNAKENDSTVCCVRYGNVMFSRGSVIPLFIDQIVAGKPLTITEPTMTRFMLDLSHAVSLVDFAFENAAAGDLFIRKAPACTVMELAECLLEMFDVDREIRVIGMRHGEKIFETLATAEELRRADDMGDYFRIRPDSRDLNYSKYFTEGDPGEISTEDYHSHNTRRLERTELRSMLEAIPGVRAALADWQAG